MRILLLILTVLCVLVASGMGFLVGNENLFGEGAEQLAELDKLAATAGGSLPPDMQDLMDKAKGYKTSGVAGLLLALLSLVVLVFSFMKNEKVSMILAGVTVLLAVVFIGMAPGFDTGENGPASPRNQVMVFAIPAMIAAVFGWLAVKKKAAVAAAAAAAAAK